MAKKALTGEQPPLIIAPKIHHGDNIAKMRDLFDWTQKDLAEKLGWRQQKVSDIEDMAVVPDEIIIEVAKVFGISAQKLKYSNVKEAAIQIFKDNEVNDGGILYVQGNVSHGGVETILQLTDKLILNEKEIREKEKELFETKLEAKEAACNIAKKEIELLQKEMALLKQA